MALIENFDVDFEDYIIFHRGVAEANVKDDGHLHIIYQDGYDQDLGDPYGNNAKEWANEAKGYMDGSKEYYDGIDAKIQEVENLLANLNQTKEEAEALKDSVNEIVDVIKGKPGGEGTEPVEGLFDELRATKTDVENSLSGILTQVSEAQNAAQNATGAANAMVTNAQAWATGTMGAGEDEAPVPSDHDAYQNNAKYYKVKADELRAIAKFYATGGTQTYTNMNGYKIYIPPEYATWVDLDGETTEIENSAITYATISRSNAEAAADRVEEAQQVLSDVQAVANENINFINSLNEIERDEDTGEYNIKTISNEYIDTQIALLFPFAVDMQQYFEATKNLDFAEEYSLYKEQTVSIYETFYLELLDILKRYSKNTEEYKAASRKCTEVNDWFVQNAPKEITSQPTDQVGAVGDNVTFAVEAQYANAYYWKYSTGGESEIDFSYVMDEDYNLINSPTLQVEVTEEKYGYKYLCDVVGFDGTRSNTDIVHILRPEEQIEPEENTEEEGG